MEYTLDHGYRLGWYNISYGTVSLNPRESTSVRTLGVLMYYLLNSKKYRTSPLCCPSGAQHYHDVDKLYITSNSSSSPVGSKVKRAFGPGLYEPSLSQPLWL